MAALPKSMLKKKEELKLAHPELVEAPQPKAVVIPIDPPAAPAVEAAVEPITVDTPSVVEDPKETPIPLEEQWRIEKDKWEQKYRSLEGVVRSLEPALQSERTKVGDLEKELQRLREAMPQPAPIVDPSEELTEDEMSVYGESAPVIQKIAKKIARGQLDAALADVRKEIKELREANSKVQTDLTQTSEQQFFAHVKSSIKNFDSVTSSKEWADYLNTRVPYSRETKLEALTRAHHSRDFDTIKELFDDFKPSKPSLDSMRSPQLTPGVNPVNTNSNTKPILKLSDRRKVSEDFRKGKITLEEKDKWVKLFKEAEAENRIDYSL
jgi:hypothetical protein